MWRDPAFDVGQLFRRFDLSLISGPALLSLGMMLARIFGLAFSLVLAAALSPQDFGVVQYGLTLGQVLSIGAQPLGQHVLSRFVGKYRRDPERLREMLSSGLLLLGVVIALTVAVAVSVGPLHAQTTIGALVVFIGFSAFYAYWGLATGFQAAARLTVVYLGSNIVQIIATVLLFSVLHLRSPLLAMCIYGLSYFLPIAVVQWRRPLPVEASPRRVSRQWVAELARFALPVWVSHACFTLATTVDVLLLERFFGVSEVGIYIVARTIALVFTFVPTSIASLLMPRVAAEAPGGSAELLRKALALSTMANGAIFVVYLLLVRWFTFSVFGPEYLTTTLTSILLAGSGIIFGIHGVITAVIVGGGNPAVETVSRLAALAATLCAAWLLIPAYGGAGAAGAVCIGAAVALLVYLARIRRPVASRQSPAAERK